MSWPGELPEDQRCTSSVVFHNWEYRCQLELNHTEQGEPSRCQSEDAFDDRDVSRTITFRWWRNGLR